MTDQSDQLYREGVAAIRAGDKATAKSKLMQAVKLDRTHEQAWLWLSAAVDTDDERIACLRNVLTINPNNETAQKGLRSLNASLETDVNAAGYNQAPPAAPTPPPERTYRMEHGAAPAVEALFEQDERLSAATSPSAPAAPAPKPNFAADESWRQNLYENQQIPAAGELKSNAKFLRDDEPPVKRDLLDLANAWGAALIFDAKGAFQDEMRVTRLGRWFVSMLAAAVLACIGQALTLFIATRVRGQSIEGILLEMAPTSGPELFDAVSTDFLVMAVMVLTFLVVMIGTPIYQVMTHTAAGFLGGSGTFVQTMHAMSITAVALQIVSLIGSVVTGFFPGAVGIVGFASLLYALVLNVMAVSAAHREFGIFKAIGSLLFGYILLFVFGCCLGVFLAFAAAPGAG